MKLSKPEFFALPSDELASLHEKERAVGTPENIALTCEPLF